MADGSGSEAGQEPVTKPGQHGASSPPDKPCAPGGLVGAIRADVRLLSENCRRDTPCGPIVMDVSVAAGAVMWAGSGQVARCALDNVAKVRTFDLKEGMTAACIMTANTFAVATGVGSTVRMFHATTRTVDVVDLGRNCKITAMVRVFDGLCLACGFADGVACVSLMAGSDAIQTIWLHPPMESTVVSMATSFRQDHILCIAAQAEPVHVYSTFTGLCAAKLGTASQARATAGAFTRATGRRACAIGYDDGSVRVWDVDRGDCIGLLFAAPASPCTPSAPDQLTITAVHDVDLAPYISLAAGLLVGTSGGSLWYWMWPDADDSTAAPGQGRPKPGDVAGSKAGASEVASSEVASSEVASSEVAGIEDERIEVERSEVDGSEADGSEAGKTVQAFRQTGWMTGNMAEIVTDRRGWPVGAVCATRHAITLVYADERVVQLSMEGGGSGIAQSDRRVGGECEREVSRAVGTGGSNEAGTSGKTLEAHDEVAEVVRAVTEAECEADDHGHMVIGFNHVPAGAHHPPAAISRAPAAVRHVAAGVSHMPAGVSHAESKTDHAAVCAENATAGAEDAMDDVVVAAVFFSSKDGPTMVKATQGGAVFQVLVSSSTRGSGLARAHGAGDSNGERIGNGVVQLCASPCGEFVVFCNRTAFMTVVQLSDARVLSRFAADVCAGVPLQHMALSRGARCLVWTTRRHVSVMSISHAGEQNTVANFRLGGGTITCLCFLDNVVYVGHDSGAVTAVALTFTGQAELPPPGSVFGRCLMLGAHSHPVACIAADALASGSEHEVLTGCAGGRVALWSTEGGASGGAGQQDNDVLGWNLRFMLTLPGSRRARAAELHSAACIFTAATDQEVFVGTTRESGAVLTCVHTGPMLAAFTYCSPGGRWCLAAATAGPCITWALAFQVRNDVRHLLQEGSSCTPGDAGAEAQADKRADDR